MNMNKIDQKITLQKAEYNDIPILAEFLGGLFSLERDFQPDIDKQSRALALLLDNPDIASVYKVISIIKTDNDRGIDIIGMIVLHKAISTAEGGWAGRIEDLYIQPEFRGQGIGAWVIDKISEIALDDGLCRITLIADRDNLPALNFYKNCGFTEMNLTSFVKKIK